MEYNESVYVYSYYVKIVNNSLHKTCMHVVFTCCTRIIHTKLSDSLLCINWIYYLYSEYICVYTPHIGSVSNTYYTMRSYEWSKQQFSLLKAVNMLQSGDQAFPRVASLLTNVNHITQTLYSDGAFEQEHIRTGSLSTQAAHSYMCS